MNTIQKISYKTMLLLVAVGILFMTIGVIMYRNTIIPDEYGVTQGILEGFDKQTSRNDLANPIITYTVDGMQYKKTYEFATSLPISSSLTVRYDKNDPGGKVWVEELRGQEKFLAYVTLAAGCFTIIISMLSTFRHKNSGLKP